MPGANDMVNVDNRAAKAGTVYRFAVSEHFA